MNCIHWVDREELPALEFLIQPQPKEGYGVFGGGWERPANVFMAAKSFTKQLKQQDAKEHHQSNHNNFTTLPVSSDALQFIAKVNNTIALLSFEFTMF